MSYWKADATTSDQIGVFLAARVAMQAKARQMAKRIGADPKRVYYSTGFFNVLRVAGFSFPAEPPQGFVRHKKDKRVWRPRANTPLDTEMQALSTTTAGDIQQLLVPQVNALMGCNMTVQMQKGVAYISIESKHTPKGCTRISDVEFEAITKLKKKTRKGKAVEAPYTVGCMETDPKTVEDPVARARLLFQQWHVDEAIGDAPAGVYADRLLERLRENGLAIVKGD